MGGELLTEKDRNGYNQKYENTVSPKTSAKSELCERDRGTHNLKGNLQSETIGEIAHHLLSTQIYACTIHGKEIR